MDSGANGGMAGSDMRILNYYAQDRAYVTGIAGKYASRSAHNYRGSYDRDHAWSGYRHFPPVRVLW